MPNWPCCANGSVSSAPKAFAARSSFAFETTLASRTFEPLLRRKTATLSAGQRSRVALAKALINDPELLLLDEPTASLDLAYQIEVAALLRRLNASHAATMVVCTHDLNQAAALCDEVVLLRDGAVLAHGPTAETITADNIRAIADTGVMRG